jgi:hypothetical protein
LDSTGNVERTIAFNEEIEAVTRVPRRSINRLDFQHTLYVGTHGNAAANSVESDIRLMNAKHFYKIRPRKDHRGVDLISDVLPFDRFWYGEPNAVNNAINYAKFLSRSHDAVIRVYDEAGNLIETYEHTGDFKEWRRDQNVCDYRVGRLS